MRHQPGMGVRRKPPFGTKLSPKVLEMATVQSSFEECTRIDSRRSVALEVDDVAFLLPVPSLEEVIKTDFIQSGRRRVGRDVPSNAALLPIGTHDHGKSIPAHKAPDALFDVAVARIERLQVERNRVYVGCVRRERNLNASLQGIRA